MLAQRIRQKHAAFYLLSVLAEDLLRRVRFTCRFHDEGGGTVGSAQAPSGDDPVSAFMAAVQRSDSAFQRPLATRKIKQLREFYRNVEQQPLIPGVIQLYTHETLEFRPVHGEDLGDLAWPAEPFLIIDGQHRLAALHFHLLEFPGQRIQVPCCVFDGQNEDFAVEMFVTINSTPTRINRSLLVELYERVIEAGDPARRLASQVCRLLYAEPDSPLQGRINRLGGRSAKDKWILQAEVFNEVLRLLAKGLYAEAGGRGRGAEAARVARVYAALRDALRAWRAVCGEAWGDARSAVTSPTVLQAVMRLTAALLAVDADDDGGRAERWAERLRPAARLVPELRRDGFYERFPAKGPVERVGVVCARLAAACGLALKDAARTRGA